MNPGMSICTKGMIFVAKSSITAHHMMSFCYDYTYTLTAMHLLIHRVPTHGLLYVYPSRPPRS